MKSLVSGATGFIGSHLVDLLLERGQEVRVLVRKSSNLRWLNGKNVEFVYGDLFTPEALTEAVRGVDYVYHSAGVTKARTPEEYYRGNAEGTRLLLGAVRETNPSLRRFVHVSSQAAAGPSPSRQPIDETAEPHPITTYGKSKWRAEQECLAVAGTIALTIVRPPVVFGPRDVDVFEFFRTMSRGLQPMVGFSEKYVSMIHVRDLIRGFVLAAESSVAVGRTYFLSSSSSYGWREIGEITGRVMRTRAFPLRIPEAVLYAIGGIAEILGRMSRKPALLNLEKVKDMVQGFWTCDGGRAKAELGFVPELSLEEGIRDAVDWYRKEGWL